MMITSAIITIILATIAMLAKIMAQIMMMLVGGWGRFKCMQLLLCSDITPAAAAAFCCCFTKKRK